MSISLTLFETIYNLLCKKLFTNDFQDTRSVFVFYFSNSLFLNVYGRDIKSVLILYSEFTSDNRHN